MGVIGYLQTMISDIQGKYRDDPKTCYRFILVNCQYLYKIFPDTEGFKSLMNAFFELDTQCGDVSPIEPKLSTEEITKRLAALDRDLEKFKSLFQTQ